MHLYILKRHVMSHHVPPGEKTVFSLPPQNDSPLFAFLQAREEALIICRAERVGGPIVSFSTGDLTSTIWAFFWPRLQLFPRYYLSQPLLKLTRSYFRISMVLLTRARQTYVDFFFSPPSLSHGMENVSAAPVG